MKYKVYVVLHDEINAGWVWLSNRPGQTRSVVRITNNANQKTIYCEALQIDGNYLGRYSNECQQSICSAENAIAINEWYRKKLGGIAPQADVDLDVSLADNFIGKLQACFQNPQVVVRQSTWIGLISVGLGVIGVALGAMSLR